MAERGGKSWCRAAVGLVATLSVFFRPLPSLSAQSKEVLLATTTSTRDAGLLDALLPIFTRKTGYTVKVIAVGSGQALELGRRGDADVVLSHAPEQERALADSGYFVSRRRVMHNDFLVVGPPDDPLGLRGATGALEAFRRVAARAHRFVSRGDRSGTHQLEYSLWRRIGVEPPRGGWYVESGQGMGETLQMADEKGAYTLTDRATYLVWRDKIRLAPLVRGDSLLYNVYHVMEVNPRNAPRVNARGGRALADFLLDPETQRLIGEFGRSRFGQSLFVPDAVTPPPEVKHPSPNLHGFPRAVGLGCAYAIHVSVVPSGGATNVNPNALIVVTFDHPMRPGMEAYAALHEGDVTGPVVAGAWTWSEGRVTLVFTPDQPLKSATPYTLHLGGGMRAMDGGYVDYGPCADQFGGQWTGGGMTGGGGMMGGGMMNSGWRHPNGTYGMTFTFTTA